MDRTRGVTYLGIAQHSNIHCSTVEIETVTPTLLSVRHHVHVAVEKEVLAGTVVGAGIRGKHIPILPGVGVVAERSQRQIRFILEPGGLDKNGIGVHIHVLAEGEGLDLGIIAAGHTFYYLAILIPHRGAVAEYGHTVLRVVVQEARLQGVVVLVGKNHDAAAELREVAVHIVIQLVAAQLGPVLDDLDPAHGIDKLVVHIPYRCVTEQIGVVVQEAGRPSHHAAAALSVHFQQLQGIGADQADQTVLVPGLWLGGGNGSCPCVKSQRQYTDCRNYEYITQGFPHPYFLTFSSQPSFSKLQSLNIGSMMIYEVFILDLTNSSMASICLALVALLSSRS